jgi:chemotaxis response regulator CheB
MANAGSHRDIVAIGASAGELPQVSMLLELLLPDLPAIVLVVLHRSGDQVSYLREVLACKSGTPVVEAIHGQELLVATCYLGQPSEHLEVEELVHAKLLSDPRMSRRGRTIDDLFGSLARDAGQGPSALYCLEPCETAPKVWPRSGKPAESPWCRAQRTPNSKACRKARLLTMESLM